MDYTSGELANDSEIELSWPEERVNCVPVMIRLLKTTQLILLLGVTCTLWLIYPGAMAVFAVMTGVIYVAASIGATKDKREAIWIAFLFSLAVAVFAVSGVRRFRLNGFDFLAGNFDNYSGIHVEPYLFLAVMILAVSVVGMHIASWRCMTGREPETKGTNRSQGQ